MSLNDTSNPEKYRSYAEFWPFYLREHSQRKARLLHIIGTFLALFALGKAFICFSLLWFLIALILGYGFAWLAHVLIEKNNPATFTYPFWSLKGDLQMFCLWISGRLEGELVRHNIFN